MGIEGVARQNVAITRQWRNGIVAIATPGVTAEDTTQAEPGAFPGAKAGDRRHAVVRTRRIKPAGWHRQGRHKELIQLN